jgi:hypothetical protein
MTIIFNTVKYIRYYTNKLNLKYSTIKLNQKINTILLINNVKIIIINKYYYDSIYIYIIYYINSINIIIATEHSEGQRKFEKEFVVIIFDKRQT